METVIKPAEVKIDKVEKKETEIPATPMDLVFRETVIRPEPGALVTGTVIGRGKMALYVDVPPFGAGIIFGREYLVAKDIIREVSEGDTITAKIIDTEGEDGYLELSLQEAKQALIWAEAKKHIEHKTPLGLTAKEANKGGLIVEWQGISGFLPASQLKPEHYPNVADGNKEKIMTELGKLVGQNLTLFVINADPREGKLIFSEKAADSPARQEIVAKYNLGDVVEGEVTGTVDFGIFVRVEEGLEGLVHISEIDWALVESTKNLFKAGDRVRAKIIEIKDGKISLSIKALKPNPWIAAGKKYAKGQKVAGVVIKYNKHGALVSIEEGVAGLVHISEFPSEDVLRRALELGKGYPFVINLFDAKNQKMTLSYRPEAK